jgi:hypothetical protein
MAHEPMDYDAVFESEKKLSQKFYSVIQSFYIAWLFTECITKQNNRELPNKTLTNLLSKDDGSPATFHAPELFQ